VCNISGERFTQETPKNEKISKNANYTKEEGSKDTLCLFMHTLEVRPENFDSVHRVQIVGTRKMP